MDEKIKKDIIKCSRCSLCADVCPLFEAKRSEDALLRGKLLQLSGVVRGELKFSNSVKSSIDECLSCDKCKNACPSGLSAVEIFQNIRAENLSFLEKNLSGKFALKIKMLVFKIFYSIKHPLKFFSGARNRRKFVRHKKLVHFNGCLSKSINTDFDLPFEFKKGDFECCGVPYKTKGNLDAYRAAERRNAEKIEKTDGFVVFNCATCLSSVRSYEFSSPETLDKLVFYTVLYKEFFQTHKAKSKKSVTVTFHAPCHLESAGVTLFDIEEILSNIENVTYKSLENPSGCCGFSGDYFTRHPKIADKLSVKKAQDVINCGAEIVLTCCPTCLWSLKYGLKRKRNFNIRALDLAEFLSSLDFTD